MTQLKTPPRLTFKGFPDASWDGELMISPVIPDDKSIPGVPGVEVGDIVLVSGDALKMLVSLGVRDKLNTSNIRVAGVVAAKWLANHQAANAALMVSDFNDLGIENAFDVFCEGLRLGAFQFDRYKSKNGDAGPVSVHLLSADDDPKFNERVDRICAVADGVNLAREWSHEPPNIINPVTLGERSQALAAATCLKCTVLGEAELSEMGAGAILSVGLGSKTPSHMIVLEHPGLGVGAESAPVVVIGKAITFDTGGYSLKNTKGMLGMKFDKCGGMAVLGIMNAVAVLNLPIPVVGIVAAAENMISSYAYRPNDIITSLSGKTIEIISTDAEGRMVLSDALTYASTELDPRAIIDLATLTGGVVTALGKVRAGLMANDDGLADALVAAGDRSDERLWRLPLDEEYFQLIKGSDSDIKNSAGVPLASSIVGGTFLKQFVLNEIPWAHIDIAGTATTEVNGVRQATGFGVRLVIDYLSHLS